MYIRSAYRKEHKIPREQREIPLETENMSPDYYNFINAEDLNNPLSLVSGGAYNTLINRVRFADCIRPKPNFMYVAIMDTLIKNEIEIPYEQKIILEKLIACETRDCIKSTSKEDTAT